MAGADANPYLVMAAIFAGILHGLDNTLPLQEEVEGNGLEQEGLPFPIRQSDALWEFMQNDSLRERLGNVSATFTTPVNMTNYCSLSVLSQKQKLSGC